MDPAFDDRRQVAGEMPSEAEAKGVDRRQFPPPENPRSTSEAGRELQEAIDAYKIERRLKRISVDELLGLLENLGYRRG